MSASSSSSEKDFNVQLPPISSSIPSTSTGLSTQNKLMKYRRQNEDQKRLNDIVINEAIKAYEETMEEKRKRPPSPPEPELPATMNSEQKKQRTNYLFLKSRVESSPVVRIQKQWLNSMLLLIPQSLKEGKEKEALVQELLQEVTSDYEKSMRRYMVRSVLVKPNVKGLEDEPGPLPEPPVGIDFSNPWHLNFVHARNEVASNLHILHPTLKLLLDTGYTTFLGLLIVDLSGYRARGPVDCESFKSDVSMECAKTEEKLINTWYPKVINLFTDRATLLGIKPGKIDSFYSCVSTLMSNQLKELLRKTVEAFVKLFSPEDTEQLPLFKMELTFDDEKMDFYPSFQDVEDVVLFVVTRIAGSLQNIQTIQSWLSGGNTVVTVEAKLPDHVTEWAFSTLRKAVRDNLEGPKSHFDEYVERFSWLVDGTADEQVQNYLKEDHSFEEYIERIEHFYNIAKEIMNLPPRAYFSMIRLDCDDLKEGLADKAKSYANRLLERIVSDHKNENERICKEFEHIEQRALKIPENTEEMIEMIEFIQHAKVQGIQELNTQIEECKRRMNYLLDVYIFSPEDLELNSTVLLWPKMINPVFDENDELIESTKHKGEAELLIKREKLMIELEKLSRRMEEFEDCSEMDMMAQYVTDVRTVQKRIQEAEESISYINKEEVLFKWDLTDYPEMDALKANIEPYQKIFGLILKWQRTEKRWMDGAFLDLNGENMEAEVDDFFREIYKMLKFFQQKQKKIEQEKQKAGHRLMTEEKREEDEEKKENQMIRISTLVMDQIKDFRVKKY